ncbi:rhodanese domain-containing protein [Haloferax larsenii JCM 13917]|nr:rhodanese-like domain-containing protein [Haloferax larsenii]ELZ78179.1 rhodanese domain-containing protein [Haloferax larsenii JCM 13917]
MNLRALQDEEQADVTLVDVRVGPPSLLEEHIPGSIHIPQSDIEARADELPDDSLIVLYCWDTWCSLAIKSAIPLLERGYDVKELYGGIAAWNTLELPTEPVEDAEQKTAEQKIQDDGWDKSCGC